MSDDSTRVLVASGVMTGATQQMPSLAGGDTLRTQMGGTAVCPVCHSTVPLMESYCGECGFLLSSVPADLPEIPSEDQAPAMLMEAGSGRQIRLRQGVNTVGRQGTDIVANDSTVSRLHARIMIEGDTVLVEDLGSTNGTKVGDLRIGPNQPTQAASGTVLKFGNWISTLEVSGTVAGGGVPNGVTVALPSQADSSLAAAGTTDTGPADAALSLLPSEPNQIVYARLIKAAGPGEDLGLPTGTVTIGRKPGNTVIIQDSYLSGRHAEFRIEGSGTTLTDLGSTNGTLLNGEKLPPNESRSLIDGDTIQLGQTRYTFQIESVVDLAEPSPEQIEPSFESADEHGDTGEITA